MLVDFPPFRADLADERLWQGDTAVPLTRKAWGVLRVLLEADGRLVTKDQLAATVWPGTHVGDDSFTKVVRELRRALGDDQRAPRFIATVHGRGYRLVARLHTGRGDDAAPPPARCPAPLTGRERELSILEHWLVEARQGQRRVGVVSGEVGIGKSGLIDALLAAAEQAPDAPLHLAAGQCVEQYGGAEPFLPVVAALRCLARGASAATRLRRVAPAWLAAACGLAPESPAADAALANRVDGLRILAEVIEELAGDTPLVFVLEDLHWSDPSTLDLVNLLARRRDPTRLLLLCTLRTSDAFASGHPSAGLTRELIRSGNAGEIALAPLPAHAVARLLAERLGGHAPEGAAAYCFRYSGGNPFFLRALCDDLLARGVLRQAGDRWELDAAKAPPIPADSLAALAPRLERLDAFERALLEGASVLGDAFSAEAIGALLCGEDAAPAPAAIEAACERFVRHRDILRAADGSARYEFRHALYRQALYEGIAPGRRGRLHGRAADALTAARPAGSLDGAASLAEHCARAGEHGRAAIHHTEAAAAARARFADREVAAHLGAALTHLQQCPQTADRDLQELMLIQQHAAAVMAVHGFSDLTVADDCRRARHLARRLGIPLAEFLATAALVFFHLMRAELDAADILAEEMTALAPDLPLPECVAAARGATGAVLFGRGDLNGAWQHLEGLRGQFPRRNPQFPLDAAVWHLALLATIAADRGEARTADALVTELLTAAAEGAPSGLANAHVLAAGVAAQLRDPRRVLQHLESVLALSSDDAPAVLLAAAGQLRAWAVAVLGDRPDETADLASDVTAWRATGQALGLPWFAVLRAEACLCRGEVTGAVAALDAGRAHAGASGEHRMDSELDRLRAECLRRAGRRDEAVAALDTALAIANRQGARLAELRAAIDMVRLHHSPADLAAATRRLAAIVAALGRDEPLPELAAAADLVRLEITAA